MVLPVMVVSGAALAGERAKADLNVVAASNFLLRGMQAQQEARCLNFSVVVAVAGFERQAKDLDIEPDRGFKVGDHDGSGAVGERFHRVTDPSINARLRPPRRHDPAARDPQGP